MNEESIHFFTEDITYQLRQRTEIRSWLKSIAKKEKYSILELNYIFCSDEYLLQINKDFLDHDYYTDIITFGLSEKGEPVEAEVYVSLDRVKDNAANLETTFKAETLRVIFHGALHLCGYKDKTKSEIIQMREKEEQYLRLFEKNK